MTLDPKTIDAVLALIFDRIEAVDQNPFYPMDLETLDKLYFQIEALKNETVN